MKSENIQNIVLLCRCTEKTNEKTFRAETCYGAEWMISEPRINLTADCKDIEDIGSRSMHGTDCLVDIKEKKFKVDDITVIFGEECSRIK
jgi:hypothetical protein